MDIYFKTGKLKKVCDNARESRKVLGEKVGKKLQQRMTELKAAISLSDISYLPPPRCHELINRKGVFSVDLDAKIRLLFIPANDPIQLKEDGGYDLDKITEIEIINIEDTHDKKNQRKGKRGNKK